MQILNCVSELGTCCSDFGLAATLNIVRNILTIIQIVVPLILIVMSTFSLTKMVIPLVGKLFRPFNLVLVWRPLLREEEWKERLKSFSNP